MPVGEKWRLKCLSADYLTRLYLPAANQGRRYLQEGYSGAREVAAWKAKVRAAWHQTAARRYDQAQRRIRFGGSIRVEVAVHLDGLAPSDVVVELMLGRPGRLAEDRVQAYRLNHVAPLDKGRERLFALDFAPELCGKLEYHVRVYPYHEMLTHRFEMGMMHRL